MQTVGIRLNRHRTRAAGFQKIVPRAEVYPQPVVEKAGEFLKGKTLSDEVIAHAAELVANRAKPMDNTDMDLYWRKEVTDDFAGYALRELRGDDMRETRLRIARQPV